MKSEKAMLVDMKPLRKLLIMDPASMTASCASSLKAVSNEHQKQKETLTDVISNLDFSCFILTDVVDLPWVFVTLEDDCLVVEPNPQVFPVLYKQGVL